MKKVKFIILIFVFFVSAFYSNVWSQNNLVSSGSWTQIFPVGTQIQGRQNHSMVYDSTSNRAVVFGGVTTTSNINMNDVWVLTNANGQIGSSQWIQLFPSGTLPDVRNKHTAVYDALTNRMIIFGGGNRVGVFDDVWVLSNANGLGGIPTWTKLTPSGSISARADHSAIYDIANNTMTVFGGENWYSNNNEVWILSNANGLGGTPFWTQVSPSGIPPSIRHSHTAIYDEINNRMTVFGGFVKSGGQFVDYNDIWVLTNANGNGGSQTWIEIAPAGVLPHVRYDHTSIYDASNNKMIIFGGSYNGGYGILNDTWELSNANGIAGTPAWSQVSPSGTLPNVRAYHSAFYDGKRMTIFGGGIYYNDVWVLNGVVENPDINLSVNSLSFEAMHGGNLPASQTFNISNSGGGTLNWTISDNADWLEIVPNTGSGDQTVTVKINSTNLNIDTYLAKILVSSSNSSNSSQEINVSYKITPFVNLWITVNDLNKASTPKPGTNATVKLYRQNNKLLSIGNSNIDGVVKFTGIQPGEKYYYKVYYTPNAPGSIVGEEFWGEKDDIIIKSGQTTYDVFDRSLPAETSIKAFNDNTNMEITNGDVAIGTPIRIELIITNPNDKFKNVRARLVLDRDKIEPFDYDKSTGSCKILKDSSEIFIFKFTPLQIGKYYLSSGTLTDGLGNDKVTSGIPWDTIQFFLVKSSIIANLENYDNQKFNVADETENIPQVFSLEQNYPNPFNPSTCIRYSLPENSFVSLKIYNQNGQEIDNLISREQNKGIYQITWYPKNIPSGIYYYKINAGKFIAIKKLSYIR